jgi:hypothetical protein
MATVARRRNALCSSALRSSLSRTMARGAPASGRACRHGGNSSASLAAVTPPTRAVDASRGGMSDAGRMPGAMFGVKAIKPARASRGAVCVRHGAPVVKDCRSDPASCGRNLLYENPPSRPRRDHPREALSLGHHGFSVTSVPLGTEFFTKAIRRASSASGHGIDGMCYWSGIHLVAITISRHSFSMHPAA